MRQDPSYFDSQEPILVYIAKRLKDALRLEGIFTEAGLDYGVEADEYHGGTIFRTGPLTGAFFYVRQESLDAAHEIMRRHGYKPFVGESQ